MSPPPQPEDGTMVLWRRRLSERFSSQSDGHTWQLPLGKMTLVSLLVALAMIVLAQNTGIMVTLVDGVTPVEKAAARRQWNLEKEGHRQEVARWEAERNEHTRNVESWQRELEELQKRQDGWMRESKAEREKWLLERKTEEEEWWRKFEAGKKAGLAQYRKEMDELERKREEWLQDAAAEREQWMKKAKKERQAWMEQIARERDEEDRRRQIERDAFEKEKEQWARDREEEERHRKEVEWKRKGAHWSEPWGSSQCSAYGMRAYSAHLLDLPGDVDWFQACSDMPIEFHGRPVEKPSKCENGVNGVWATWYIDFGEPQCVTYWDRLHDMGCSAGQTGMRRLEARLMNLRGGDDWDSMCRTTPAKIAGIYFAHPTACEDKDGRTGIWDVPDDRCHNVMVLDASDGQRLETNVTSSDGPQEQMVLRA